MSRIPGARFGAAMSLIAFLTFSALSACSGSNENGAAALASPDSGAGAAPPGEAASGAQGVPSDTSGTVPPEAIPPAASAASPPSAPAATANGLSLAAAQWLEPVVLDALGADASLRSGRPATLRVVLSSTTGQALPAPRLHATVKNASGATVFDADMAAASATVPASADLASLANGYRVTLRGDVVQPGMQVSVKAVDQASPLFAVTPKVDPQAILYLTVVPVQTPVEGTAHLPREDLGPDAIRAAVRSTILSMYPLTDVRIRVHPVYVAQSVTTVAGNWGKLLGEMNTLWINEGKHAYYMGFMPRTKGFSAVVGNSFTPGTITTVAGAVSSDSTEWKGTVRHELGHNFGWFHPSQCSVIGNAGDLGYDADADRLIDLGATQDIMSYCSPAWIGASRYASAKARFDKGLQVPPADIVGEWQ